MEIDAKESRAGCVLLLIFLPILLLDAWIIMSSWNLFMPLVLPDLPKVNYLQAFAADSLLTIWILQYTRYPYKKKDADSPTKKQDALDALLNRRIGALITLGFGWLILRLFLGG
jgi:hypothetical protein